MKKALTSRTFLGIIALALFFGVVIATNNPQMFSDTQRAITNKSDEFTLNADNVVARVNAYREGRQLKPLTVSETVVLSASTKNKDMLEKQYWDHTSPTGVKQYEKLTKSGCKNSGENLSITTDGISKVMNGWINSKSHKKNMLDKRWDTTGVSVMRGNLGPQYPGNLYIVTQHFCQTK